MSYVTSAEDAARVPASQRIFVTAVTTPEHPVLVKGRNLTVPLAVFAALMVLLGLAAISRFRTRRS